MLTGCRFSHLRHLSLFLPISLYAVSAFGSPSGRLLGSLVCWTESYIVSQWFEVAFSYTIRKLLSFASSTMSNRFHRW